jgi:hypothetical protein
LNFIIKLMDLFDELEIIIKIQNIQLLKMIAFTEGWNYIELCKEFL